MYVFAMLALVAVGILDRQKVQYLLTRTDICGRYFVCPKVGQPAVIFHIRHSPRRVGTGVPLVKFHLREVREGPNTECVCNSRLGVRRGYKVEVAAKHSKPRSIFIRVDVTTRSVLLFKGVKIGSIL